MSATYRASGATCTCTIPCYNIVCSSSLPAASIHTKSRTDCDRPPLLLAIPLFHKTPVLHALCARHARLAHTMVPLHAQSLWPGLVSMLHIYQGCTQLGCDPAPEELRAYIVFTCHCAADRTHAALLSVVHRLLQEPDTSSHAAQW